LLGANFHGTEFQISLLLDNWTQGSWKQKKSRQAVTVSILLVLNNLIDNSIDYKFKKQGTRYETK